MPIIVVGMREDRERAHQARDRQDAERFGRHAVQRDINRRRRIEQDRRQQAGDPDQDFRDAEGGERRDRRGASPGPTAPLPIARPAMNAASTVLAA